MQHLEVKWQNVMFSDAKMASEGKDAAVLRPSLLLYLNSHPEVQQDKARPHIARRIKNFLRENGVDVLS